MGVFLAPAPRMLGASPSLACAATEALGLGATATRSNPVRYRSDSTCAPPPWPWPFVYKYLRQHAQIRQHAHTAARWHARAIPPDVENCGVTGRSALWGEAADHSGSKS